MGGLSAAVTDPQSINTLNPATYGYLNDMPFTDIAVRGRWKSINSATHYVQQFRQALLTRVIPDGVAVAAKVATSQSLIASIGEIWQHVKDCMFH